MEPNSNQKILNEHEVSLWLGVSEPTLFRHRRDGTGPRWIQLSERRIGYRANDVDEWITSRTTDHIGGIKLSEGS